eukprot:GHVL01007241.1.p1 GENE.GHVL01007241.1~~GHVL01007241.1.p1  ORF type:complete len:156 (-),score=43.75 GHVL01007241.1:184-627(-)
MYIHFKVCIIIFIYVYSQQYIQFIYICIYIIIHFKLAGEQLSEGHKNLLRQLISQLQSSSAGMFNKSSRFAKGFEEDDLELQIDLCEIEKPPGAARRRIQKSTNRKLIGNLKPKKTDDENDENKIESTIDHPSKKRKNESYHSQIVC